MLPLHHGDGTAEPSNWLERVNDSSAGVLMASILHSVGALLFAGGIAYYLWVAHTMRRAARTGGPAQVGLLPYAHAFTLGGIVLNGVGGLMRLYQSDHPGLERLADSTWVQVLLVKHLFLIAGVALALWLAWRTRNLSADAEPSAPLEREASGMAWFAAASLTSILLAAVLGAAAANVDLAADLGVASPLIEPPADEHGAHAEAAPVGEFSTGGKITGTPARPESQDHGFTVGEGADRVTATLTWTTPDANSVSPVELRLQLLLPSGDAAPAQAARLGQSLTLVVAGPQVVVGTWTARVTSTRSLEEAYDLRVDIVRSGGQGNVLERTFRLAGGDFYEANLLMAQGNEIAYDWSVVEPSARKVDFNVHVHVGESVEYPVQGEYGSLRGNYTHDGRSQGPSLMWENRGGEDVVVRYRVLGDFAIHSFSG